MAFERFQGDDRPTPNKQQLLSQRKVSNRLHRPPSVSVPCCNSSRGWCAFDATKEHSQIEVSSRGFLTRAMVVLSSHRHLE